MRRSEGPHSFGDIAASENSGDGMDSNDFERFVFAQRGEDRRHPPRQHCLSGARRGDQEHVMAPGSCNFERTLGCLLANDVREVSCLGGRLSWPVDFARWRQRSAAQLANQITECGRRREMKRAYPSGFGHVGRRKNQRRDASAQRVPSDRQCAANWPQSTVKTELTHEHARLCGAWLELAGGYQNSDRNRQIERSAFLSYISRGQVDGDETRRPHEAGIYERSTDAFAAFLDRARSEPNDSPLRKSLCRVDLDDHIIGVDSNQRGRANGGEHPSP